MTCKENGVFFALLTGICILLLVTITGCDTLPAEFGCGGSGSGSGSSSSYSNGTEEIAPRSPVSGTYHLTFRDEFDRMSIQNPYEDEDSSPTVTARGWWRPVYNWGSWPMTEDARYTAAWEAHVSSGNDERQWYVWNQYRMENGEIAAADTFTAADGILTIQGRPLNAHEREVQNQKLIRKGIEYWSGILTTFPNFSQRYGYFELRAQLPEDGPGLWPAFWLLPSDWNWPPEIDIFEFVGRGGNDPNGSFQIVCHSIHTPGNGSQINSEGDAIPMPNGARGDDGFHVYGLEWLPSELIFYVDGVETYRRAVAVDTPMYVLINLAIGGTWPGYPDAATPWPARMKLDYLRVFSKDRPGSVQGPG